MYIPYTPLLYVLKSRQMRRINELPQHLSAHTAWCSVSGLRKRIFVKFPAYDRDCRKFPAAFTHSLEDGCPLCTVSRCKCCVLNIASGVYLRICPKQCRPNCKVRIRCIRKLPCIRCNPDQDFVSFSFLISYTALSCIL